VEPIQLAGRSLVGDANATGAAEESGSHSDLSDAQLWELAATEPDAFGLIFERHVQRVFGYCARRTADLSLAEDLTSVVFLHAWTSRTSVRLIEDSALPWLLGVATNVLRNSRRSARRYDAALARLPGTPDTEDHAERVADKIDAEHRLAAAVDAMTDLRPDERDVAQLVWWSGLTYDEAAVALNIPVGTVRSRLSRARARLHRCTPDSEAENAARPAQEYR
jgi:RNA polymerase sigma factor (sigma-70 family)